MHFYPNERLGLFIDGANLHATLRALNFNIDYQKLLAYFRERTFLIRANYYTAMLEDINHSPIRPLVDWLDYNGFSIISKPVKEFTDEQGHRKIKGNMDTEIAVDIMTLAPHLDHVVLFSGDGDFRYLLEAIQQRGLRTTVISTTKTKPQMIADDLRRQADQFIDLSSLSDEFGRAGENDGDEKDEFEKFADI